LDIRNIGVLMFAEHPEKFIPGSYIELIRFNTKEAEASDDFIEKTFTGPIWKQVQDALDYINTNVIEEKVVKLQGQAESERFFHKSNTGTDGLENYLKKLICQRKKAQVFPKYYVNLRKMVLLDRNLIWMMTEHI